MLTKNIINTGNLKSDLYVKTNIGQMETSADFNGTVIQTTYIDPVTNLSFLLNHISKPYAIPYNLLIPSVDSLLKTPFDKLKSNFIRVNIAEPGETNVFNPAHVTAFINNCGVTARLAANSRVIGIFLDCEAYASSIFWKYEALSALNGRGISFAEYQTKYYEVGALIGQEITKEYPNIKIAIAISFEQLRSVPVGDLPTNRYGLLPSFLNGLHDGVGLEVRLINSLEDGYANRVDGDFDYDLAIQEPKNVPYLTSTNYSNVHVHGMSTWCDYPGTGFDFVDTSKNYNTPQIFQGNVQKCAERVDWIFMYCQQLNWQAPTVGNAPPEPYLKALSSALRPYVRNTNSSIMF